MINLYIDADSCPVKDEILRVSMRHNLEVYLVSNKWTTKVFGPKIHKILVSSGADIADNWIVEHVKQNDIVITADILLAQRCLALSAFVISPTGKSFTPDNIGMSVAMRNLNSHLREIGEISSHNKIMTKQDKSKFMQELELVIQNIYKFQSLKL